MNYNPPLDKDGLRQLEDSEEALDVETAELDAYMKGILFTLGKK